MGSIYLLAIVEFQSNDFVSKWEEMFAFKFQNRCLRNNFTTHQMCRSILYGKRVIEVNLRLLQSYNESTNSIQSEKKPIAVYAFQFHGNKTRRKVYF